MDRNVVTATVLIAVIMFAWLWWIAPSPDELSNTRDPLADTTEVVQDAPVPHDVLAEQGAPAAPGDSTFAAVQQGEEQFVTIETDLYTARFSTKGATPVSFQLKEYKKFDQETPVELIRAVRAIPGGDHIGALALSAQASDEDRRRALEAGFDAFLSKPCDGITLVRALERLAGSRAQVHPEPR